MRKFQAVLLALCLLTSLAASAAPRDRGNDRDPGRAIDRAVKAIKKLIIGSNSNLPSPPVPDPPKP
jgi:hypothetical protein